LVTDAFGMQIAERFAKPFEGSCEYMDLSGLMQRLQIFIPSMDLGMEPKTFALLVAILLFLISFLVNLLQHRYSKARFDHMLKKDKSIVPLLEGLDKYLGELEWSCLIDMDRGGSLKKAIKEINAARDKIERILIGSREKNGYQPQQDPGAHLIRSVDRVLFQIPDLSLLRFLLPAPFQARNELIPRLTVSKIPADH